MRSPMKTPRFRSAQCDTPSGGRPCKTYSNGLRSAKLRHDPEKEREEERSGPQSCPYAQNDRPHKEEKLHFRVPGQEIDRPGPSGRLVISQAGRKLTAIRLPFKLDDLQRRTQSETARRYPDPPGYSPAPDEDFPRFEIGRWRTTSHLPSHGRGGHSGARAGLLAGTCPRGDAACRTRKNSNRRPVGAVCRVRRLSDMPPARCCALGR